MLPKQKKIIIYNLTFGNGTCQVRVNKKTKMLFVDVFGVLPDCIGLMGYAGKPYGLFARDGKTDLTGEWNSFGEEWQVQDDDPIFFIQRPIIWRHDSDVKQTHLTSSLQLLRVPMQTGARNTSVSSMSWQRGE
jgi:hypothetical protein